MRGWTRVTVLSAAFVLALGAGTGLLFAMRGEDSGARQSAEVTEHDTTQNVVAAAETCSPSDPCGGGGFASDKDECAAEGDCAAPSSADGCTPEECGVCTSEGVCSSPAMRAPACAADVAIEKCYPDARPAGPLECTPAPDGAPIACVVPCVIEGVPMPVEPAPLPIAPSPPLPPEGSTPPGLPVSPDGTSSNGATTTIACPPQCDTTAGATCGPVPCPLTPDAPPCGHCIETQTPSDSTPNVPSTMPCWIGCDVPTGALDSLPCPAPPCGLIPMRALPPVPGDGPAPDPQPVPCPSPCVEPPVKPSPGIDIAPCAPAPDGGTGSSGGGSAPASTAVAEPGTVAR